MSMIERSPLEGNPSRVSKRLLVAALAAGAISASILPILTPRASAQPATETIPSFAAGKNTATLPLDLQRAIEHARDTVFPALVNIQVVSVSYYGGQENKGASIGSGTIISADGLVVTNHHVVENGRTFRVTLSNKRELPATLVGEDPLTDLAVLRIDMDALKKLGGTLPGIATWGDSTKLETGDYVVAMGAPFGLSRSITLGIVSNTERVFTSSSGDDIADQEFDFETSSDVFTRWIQHDALILPGNSGGPLVDLNGSIVGVNTRGGSGIGFANPAQLVRTIVDELVKDGVVTRSTIGASFKSVRRTGIDRGVLVNSVDADGASSRGGLRAGDVIVAIDAAPINARFAEEIPLVLRAIAERPIGTALYVTYLRDGAEASTTITTEKMMRERGDETALRLFGLSATEITDRIVRARRLESRDGAMILGIRSGGPASLAEPSINRGSVILAVNGTRIKTLADFVDAYKKIAAQDPLPEFVTIEFNSRGRNMVTLIKPRPDKRDDPPRELPKAWIGIATQPVLRDLARELGIPDQLGFRVTRLYPSTVAFDSGLKVGDVITHVNNDLVAPRGMQDAGMLNRKIRTLRAGETATLKIIRSGAPTELSINLERTRLTAEEALRDTNRDFELTVREMTFFDRDDNRWDESVAGVIVENAEQVGWAGMAGIYSGDLIQRIDSTTITDLASYRAAMAEIGKKQPERVTFVVLRGLRTQFKFAEPDWKPVMDAAKDEKEPDAPTPDEKPATP